MPATGGRSVGACAGVASRKALIWAFLNDRGCGIPSGALSSWYLLSLLLRLSDLGLLDNVGKSTFSTVISVNTDVWTTGPAPGSPPPL